MRRMLFIMPALVVGFLVASRHSHAQHDQSTKTTAVQTEMMNVMYHFTNNVTVHILELHGSLVPVGRESLPIFDDSRSFNLEISSADINMTTDSLANVLNQYVFAASDAPLKGLSVTTEGNSLKVKGKLHSKGDISFETVGTISATPEGQIRIHRKLYGISWSSIALRQAHDVGHRHDPDRYGPQEPIRFLSRSLPRSTGGREYENHTRVRIASVHAGLQ